MRRSLATARLACIVLRLLGRPLAAAGSAVRTAGLSQRSWLQRQKFLMCSPLRVIFLE